MRGLDSTGCAPAALAVLLLVLLAGCTRTQAVTVEVPTTDAVNAEPTVFVPVPRAPELDTTGRASAPLRTELYVEPDTLDEGCVTAVVQTDSSLTIRTRAGSQTFRSPECGSGQVQTITPSAPTPRRNVSADTSAAPPGPFRSVVRGRPQPRAVTVECPACPNCIVARTIPGRLKLSFWLVLTFAAGGVVGFMAAQILRPR